MVVGKITGAGIAGIDKNARAETNSRNRSAVLRAHAGIDMRVFVGVLMFDPIVCSEICLLITRRSHYCGGPYFMAGRRES
jgi:hypothetical protein